MGILPPFPDDFATSSQWFSGTAPVIKEYHMLEKLKSTVAGSWAPVFQSGAGKKYLPWTW
jgi:hypothetical protein